jgi:hypothetical protein
MAHQSRHTRPSPKVLIVSLRLPGQDFLYLLPSFRFFHRIPNSGEFGEVYPHYYGAPFPRIQMASAGPAKAYTIFTWMVCTA